MTQSPPQPEALAHWLLTHEAGRHDSPDAVVAAAERIHARLRAGLLVFVGQTGFDSLWARAMHLAHRTFPRSVSVGEGASPPFLQDLRAAVQGRDASEACDILLAVLTSFITSLFTFVGAELGVRLLQQVWPELPLGEWDPPTGDATP